MSLIRKLRRVSHLRRPRIGFHTIWTRPADNFHLADFEILTLITSALEWKRHNGHLRLYTDRNGAAWIHSKGLGWLYDDILTTLENIPQEIDPKLFWAAGKLYAYQSCAAPCVSIDYDAIIWKRLPRYVGSDVVALHAEPSTWGGYANAQNWPQFDGLDWQTPSLNAGVLIFNDQELKDTYTKSAIEFMRQRSMSGQRSEPYKNLFGPDTSTYIEEMIFAEQRLLSMLVKQMGRKLNFITDFDLREEHITANEAVTHLWNSKRGYKEHGRAREHYNHYLLCHLYKNHPQVLRTLKRLNLASSVVMDANVPAPRFAPAGDWELPGEEIHHF